MNNSESGFNAFSNGIEQPINPEQTRQPSPEETKKLGSSALNGYGPNEIFVEQQAQGVPEVQETQEVQEVQETPIPVTPEIPDVRPPQPEEITSVISELAGVEWHQPLAENTQPVAETASDNEETEKAHENFAHRIFEKAKGSRVFKTAVAAGLAATIVLSLAACGANKDTNQASNQSASESIEQVESTALSGEQSNGVIYDYSHYADREGKESANAYDYDMSDCYGDEETFKVRIMEVAKRTPEALSSYAFTILTPEEKAELGIDGKSMVEIDDVISNDPNGGALQQKIIAKFKEALNDPDTVFKFYKENDYETSSYVYFIDDNDDGIMSPNELHIGYADAQRKGAPQVDIKRPMNKKRPLASGTSSSGKWETAYYITDINLSCGGQVNYDEGDFPPGVPYIDPNDPNPTPEKPTTPPTEASTTPPTEKPTKWGKEGDPHGGPDVTLSDKVNLNSEVSEEQNDGINKGNQGYVDDNQATPGSGSENNSSGGSSSGGVTAPGANNGGRVSGGENQSGPETNGENAYNNPEQISQGQKVDSSGNSAQEEAQKSGGESGNGAAAGEDNYSNSGEEAAVANGDF